MSKAKLRSNALSVYRVLSQNAIGVGGKMRKTSGESYPTYMTSSPNKLPLSIIYVVETTNVVEQYILSNRLPECNPLTL